MSTDIKYTVVKAEDISLAMKASATSTTAQRKMEGQDGIVWEQTVVSVMENLDMSEVKRGSDKDAIKHNGALIKKMLADKIMATTTIPEEGKNRQGQSFKVCGKNGLPQWSSWDLTRRIWDYAGSVGKILAFSQESVLYPEAMKVGARCEVIKLCKVAEPHMDAIKRQVTGLQNSLDSVSNAAEAHVAQAAVSSLMVNNLDFEVELKNMVALLSAKLDIASDSQKSAVKAELIAMATTHFANI